MATNKSIKDLKTPAYVLRRTNYGEADRILNLITPQGKISALAKGVRKEKSRLAGGVEMFTLSEINLHLGRGNLATVTGTKMQKFYKNILKDLTKMELAAEIFKKISRASDEVETEEHFKIVDMCLLALNDGAENILVETWFLFNLAKSLGEQINLYTDVSGEKLSATRKYSWDFNEMGLLYNNGPIDANMIKIMRLMITSDLEVITRIKNTERYLPEILRIAQAMNKF